MSIVRIVFFLWAGLYLALGPLHSIGDGDLYWQRWLGDLLLKTRRLPTVLGSGTFTAPGAPWVPQEWFFSLAAAAASDHHLFLLFSIAVSAMPVLILASIYWRARGAASAEAIGVALLFCGIALLESFGVRAQVLGWAGLAAFLVFLERRDRWYYGALPAAIVWANVHASVMIAPAIVLARVIATVADGGLRALRSSRDLLLLPLVIFATFCTPLTWRLPYLAVTLASSPIRRYITEWQPVTWHDLSFTLGALPLALAVIAGGRATLSRERLQAFPAAVLFLAMLFATRNIPLFAIAAAPLAARGLDFRFGKIGQLGKKARELEPVALPGIALAIVFAAVSLTRAQQREPSPLPGFAIASLSGDGATHRVFCEDFTWCSMALGYPTLRVFIDGRCDAYPLLVWRQYISTVQVRGAWRDPLNAYGVDSIVTRTESPLALALAKTPNWERSYRDASFVVFRRD